MAVKLTVKVCPACAAVGVKVNCPEAGLPVAGFGVKLAFGGRLLAVSVTVSPESASLPEAMKVRVLPACTLCDPGRLSVGG